MILSTLIAFFLTTIFGFIWYSPRVFGGLWAQLIRKKLSEMNMTPSHMVYGLSANFIMTLSSGILVRFMGITSLKEAFSLALVAGLGLGATTVANLIVWEGRPFNLFLINAGHTFGVVFISAITYTWFQQ